MGGSPLQDQRYGSPDRRATICLLVDVANIPEDAIMPLVQELRRRGSLAAMFAFGDWHRRDMHLRHRLLDALGFLCIHGGSWENGSGGLKSMVDSIMKRTIKWMPQWFPTCDTYVLATGDRDFAHDASDLRWRGYQVWIAAGEASINNELRLGADEFINLDRLPGRVAPSVLLGVPPNYYETTFGPRRSFRSGASAPLASPPPAPLAAPPAPAVPAPPPRPVAPPAAPAVVTPPPAVVVSDEDQALLAQLRDLAGERGFVPQREALRALAPVDDPGGRVRSRLSNQIRDLVERNLLIRTHATIGGNITQVLALPGVAIAPAAAPASEPVSEPEPAGDRRGRRVRRRGRGAALDELAPAAEAPVAGSVLPEAPAELPAASEPAEIGEPWVAEPVEPVVARAVVAPPAPVSSEAPAAPEVVAAPAEPEERLVEPVRPAIRRVERPFGRPAPAPAPVAPAAPRPSWREAVAAALARVRGETEGGAAPVAPAPPAAVAAEPAAPVAPAPSHPAPAVAREASGEPAPEPAVNAEAAPAEGEVPGPARRRRRRRATGAPAEAPVDAAVAGDGAAMVTEELPAALAEPAAANGEESAEAAPATAEESPRRRAPRRRRRPAAGGSQPAEAAAPATDLAGI